VITPGRYSAWFRTQAREGSGIVAFGPEGKLTGSDDTFVYDGTGLKVANVFELPCLPNESCRGRPACSEWPGPTFLWSGYSTVSCSGFAMQAPG
jgi:hypothetical protein